MKKRAALLLGLALLGASPPAAARTEAEKQAQVLFDEAMRLMNQKKYADACPKLAQSQELDPGMGTQFRLAECYEKLGRLATAYDLYQQVVEGARSAKNREREALAQKRAAALEPKIPRLTIDVPAELAAMPGLEVARDGQPVDRRMWGTPLPVDAGEHSVTAKAPGKKPWVGKATLEGTARLTLSVPSLEPLPVDAPPPPVDSGPSAAPAIALGVTGGVGLVLGATFVGLRAKKSGDATALHDRIAGKHGTCVGGGKGTAFAADCKALASATSSGDTFGTASLVGFLVGGAAAAAMTTYLLWPDPKPARPGAASLRLAPALAPGEAGIAAWGAF